MKEKTTNSPVRFEIPSRPLSGKRIRAGFHCHTTNSDGGLSPRKTVERYREKGFQCLGITDHRQVTRLEKPPGGDFLVLEATENGGEPDIIGVGVENPVPVEMPFEEKAALLTAQGGFTIAAHPAFCGAMPEEYLHCARLAAIEIFNAYADDAYGVGCALELWDMLLGSGQRILGVAGDDAHLNPRKKRYSDAGKAWVEIWADGLTRRQVMEALRRGSFFSTRGPVFEEISIEENRIAIECSPAREVRWRSCGRLGYRFGYVHHAPDDRAITSSSLPEHLLVSKYVRIELVDENGLTAWSNPIFNEAAEPGKR